MTYAPFVHLRVHSAYSLAEGAIKFPDLMARCLKDQMPAIALTDTDNLFGALEFSKLAMKDGIQPIIGCQLRLGMPKDDIRRQELLLPGAKLRCDRIVLLAQNETGYKNLVRLVSHAYIDESHHPHVNFESLLHHNEGLIALSGGMESGGVQLLLQKKIDAATHYFQTLKDVFGDRYYLEISRFFETIEDEFPADRAFEDQLIQLAYDLDIPLVATNEAFFLDSSMYQAHDALLCVAANTYVSVQDRRKVTPYHRLRSPRQMIRLFKDLPEAIENTVIISKRCGFMVEPCKPLLPPFKAERPEDEEMAHQAREGLEARMQYVLNDQMPANEREVVQQEYSARLEEEIQIINRMGYAGYYLIVADFIKWSKQNGIPVGPGRGSGAGSLVAWVLTITDIDPIRFGLLFERFLNPERVSMPDFDVDFCQDRRDEVIGYVKQQYGADRVAQISTFGKLQARAVLRDVGRVLGMPYSQVDRISKMIPNSPANPMTLSQAYAQDPQLQRMAKDETAVQNLIDIAMKLEGLYRHVSTHAAGIVIGDRPLVELVPLYFDGKSQIPATQFNMKDVETAGLVKFDFLGLKTLTIIQKTVNLVKRRDIDVDISQIPLDDAKTFEALCRLETLGIFQVEGAGMRDVLKRMQPNRFEELIALVALYRPGPMDDIPRYLACKHGHEAVNYGHELIEEILQETYGVMVYQEQVMKIAQVMGGYTLGAADLLRRAMGKKIKSEMDAQREIFVAGAKKNGIKKELSSQIFDQMAKFAGYGFNKCHSGPYALITYQTAYLKANYPVEFMAASMSYDMNNTEKLSLYCEELRRLKIPLLPPNINKSFPDFAVEFSPEGQACIRYALSAVKSVGDVSMKDLVEERAKGGPFKNLIDFARRLDTKVVNKRMLENLISAGAFDLIHANRQELFQSVDMILKHVGEVVNQRKSLQSSLFGDDLSQSTFKIPEASPWTRLECLQKELDAMGFYLSGHPLDAYGVGLDKLKLTTASELEIILGSSTSFNIDMAGVVTSKKERMNKKGARFAFVTFSDATGSFEVAVFPELYGPFRDKLEAGAMMHLKVSGRLEGDQVRMTVNTLEDLDGRLYRQLTCHEIHLTQASALEPLKKMLSKAYSSKGNGIIKLVLKAQDHRVVLKLKEKLTMTPDMRDSIESIHGVEFLRDI
ncbi:MAG: DNA polymerase III subunit alpha [Janthinobacterium lividum]